MKIIADDYKGKWFTLQDEDLPIGFERKEVNIEWLLNEGLQAHVENCLYYGIPPYLGKDEELNAKIETIMKKLTDE